MSAESQVLGAAFLVLVGIAIGGAIDEKSFATVTVVLLPAVTTLAAAFFGAKYAFALQDAKTAHESVNEKVAAVNRVIFALARQYNKLNNFYTQFVKPFEDNPAAFLQMLPLLDQMEDDTPIDVDAITFLLETEQRNLLGQAYPRSRMKHEHKLNAIGVVEIG